MKPISPLRIEFESDRSIVSGVERRLGMTVELQIKRQLILSISLKVGYVA